MYACVDVNVNMPLGMYVYVNVDMNLCMFVSMNCDMRFRCCLWICVCVIK